MSSRHDRWRKLVPKQMLDGSPFGAKDVATTLNRREVAGPYWQSLRMIEVLKREMDGTFERLSAGFPQAERPEISLAKQKFKSAFREASQQTNGQIVAGNRPAELYGLLRRALHTLYVAFVEYVFAVLQSYQETGRVGLLERHGELASVTYIKLYSRRDEEEAALEAMLDVDERSFSFDDLYADAFSEEDPVPSNAAEESATPEPTLWKHAIDFFAIGRAALPASMWLPRAWMPARDVLQTLPRQWWPYLRVTYGPTCCVRTEALSDEVESPDLPVNEETTFYVLHLCDFVLCTWTSADIPSAMRLSSWRPPLSRLRPSSMAGRGVVILLVVIGFLLLGSHWLHSGSDRPTTTPLDDQRTAERPLANPFAQPAEGLRSELLSDLDRFDEYYERRSSR